MDKFKNYEDLFADASGKEDDSDELFLTEQESELVDIGKDADETLEKWKILIVDDEEDIHSVTRIALKGFTFRGKPVEFYDAFSAAEAEKNIKRTSRYSPHPAGCGDGDNQCGTRPCEGHP